MKPILDDFKSTQNFIDVKKGISLQLSVHLNMVCVFVWRAYQSATWCTTYQDWKASSHLVDQDSSP